MMRTRIFGRQRGGAAALAFVLMLAAAPRAGAAFYTITDLGNLGTNAPTIAGTGINAGGAVAGYYSGDGTNGFLATNGPMASVGTLGGSASYATGINDNGLVVGYSATADNTYDVFTYTKAGGLVDVTATKGVKLGSSTYNFASAINNSGQIAGYAITGSGTHAFLYDGTTTKDLGTLPGYTASSQAYALNASGQVVGISTSSSAGASHAFLYSGGSMHDLGTIGNSSGNSAAYDINASGQVVGNSYVNNSSIYHAFLYNGATMVDLTPGAAYANYNSQALGVDSAGDVVGTFGTTSFSSHGYLYSGGVLTDLNTLIDPGLHLTITGAYGINDAGQIAAVGLDSQGNSHALLLTGPALLVPEPPTLALICTGALLGLGLRKGWRRELTAAVAERPATEG